MLIIIQKVLVDDFVLLFGSLRVFSVSDKLTAFCRVCRYNDFLTERGTPFSDNIFSVFRIAKSLKN